MVLKKLICTNCPLGCVVNVELENQDIIRVYGYGCKRGLVYAQKEITDPVRTLTSTVKVEGGQRPLVSVKTKQAIPKNKIFDCMDQINSIIVKAPIRTGSVLIENVGGTGIDVVATKDVKITSPICENANFE